MLGPGLPYLDMWWLDIGWIMNLYLGAMGQNRNFKVLKCTTELFESITNPSNVPPLLIKRGFFYFHQQNILNTFHCCQLRISSMEAERSWSHESLSYKIKSTPSSLHTQSTGYWISIYLWCIHLSAVSFFADDELLSLESLDSLLQLGIRDTSSNDVFFGDFFSLFLLI